jgi:long-chain acyl-CoA synthetase
MPDYAPANGPAPTLPELLTRAAARYAERPALWRWVDARFESVRYKEVIGTAQEIARRLRERGADIDHRVAIAITDRFTWGMTFLGVLFSGATTVPIDPLLTPGEIGSILDDADVSLIIHDGRIDLGELINSDRVVPLSSIWPGFGDDVDGGDFTPPPLTADHLAGLIFTSGTTGRSKGVMLSHGNLTSDILGLQALDLLFDSDILLSVLPIHHSFESTAGFLLPLATGCQVFYARSLKSKEIIADLKASRATTIFAVPLLFENIVNTIQRTVASAGGSKQRMFSSMLSLSRGARKFGMKRAGRFLFGSVRRQGTLDSLRFLVSGGAALPPFVAEFFDTIGIPLLQGYGLTETSPVVSVNWPTKYRYDTVGPPIPSCEVKIFDARSDGIGEIGVRGPMVMKGYWKKPEETAEVMRDGWFLTGDLGMLEPDGHLRICGRSKNLIVSGAGKNVYPEEVEAVLCARPEIAEAVVYGRTRPGKIGETVAAIVVPDEEWFIANQPAAWNDDGLLRTALTDAAKAASDTLAPFKRITQVDFQREPFVKTSSRKIKRAVVLKAYETPYKKQAVSSTGEHLQ